MIITQIYEIQHGLRKFETAIFQIHHKSLIVSFVFLLLQQFSLFSQMLASSWMFSSYSPLALVCSTAADNFQSLRKCSSKIEIDNFVSRLCQITYWRLWNVVEDLSESDCVVLYLVMQAVLITINDILQANIHETENIEIINYFLFYYQLFSPISAHNFPCNVAFVSHDYQYILIQRDVRKTS